ncbi:GntR family transcriptional regulator [Enterovirga rhinocerotis]|uniref:GntR family transcriptional regulator n=1 Tax=Enterovirga rhinocerotis TaxID=1339210 RepID=A0A4R7BY82_9HYPH|nr:GntR family transcriptional regulator [Enterovirga rhinocerotis]TDR89167.1 GntR family transcriptional regulator [Enterovirga rhinocerotis]
MRSAEARSPKYALIADSLRQRIARGHWPKDTRLPAAEALAREFGVSRLTVRQALDILAREGLVEARQGSGTYVTASPEQDRRLRVGTSLAALVELYRDTSPEILTIAERSAAPRLTQEDGLPASGYVHMRRLHSRDGEPYCVIGIYLAEHVFRQQPERFRREVVIPILASMTEPAIARALQTFTIGTADLDVAKALGVPLGSPVAEVRRVFASADGTVIYLGEVTYRGDFVRIEMDLDP